MKKISIIFGSIISSICLSFPATAIAIPHQPLPLNDVQLISNYLVNEQANSSYNQMDTEELWTLFSQAEAKKKLYELKQKAVHEQIKLYERPGVHYYPYALSSDTYTQLLELKNQEYEIKTQKEQSDWQKKQIESYLKLTGEKMTKAEIQYALYTNNISSSGSSYEELYQQLYALEMKEQNLELQKKNLEYQYQMGQLKDNDFINQFASVFLEKEQIKTQKEQVHAELDLKKEAYLPQMPQHYLP